MRGRLEQSEGEHRRGEKERKKKRLRSPLKKIKKRKKSPRPRVEDLDDHRRVAPDNRRQGLDELFLFFR